MKIIYLIIWKINYQTLVYLLCKYASKYLNMIFSSLTSLTYLLLN